MTTATLSDAMEFDHVIQVMADGTVVDAPRGIYAPEMYDDEVARPWRLMTGYTGQYGYNGPTMHASELIGGRLERDILATPGYYVAVVSIALSNDDDEDDVAGWGIAYCEFDPRSASLGVGHIWTAVDCPAYRTLRPADCTCER